METITASQRLARMLLGGWASADPARIRSAANLAAAAAAAPASSAEAERIEVIREAGGVLRQWTDGTALEADLKASLFLLRHFSGAESKEEFRPETRVSALH